MIRAALSGLFRSPYFAPSVVGGAIAFVVSTAFNFWNTLDKTTQERQAQAATFSKILTQSVLNDTKPFDKDSTIYDEKKATVSLLALDALAVSEEERRTVLYIGARLLTASSTRADTGGPGARFLDVAIGRIKADIATMKTSPRASDCWRSFDRAASWTWQRPGTQRNTTTTSRLSQNSSQRCLATSPSPPKPRLRSWLISDRTCRMLGFTLRPGGPRFTSKIGAKPIKNLSLAYDAGGERPV